MMEKTETITREETEKDNLDQTLFEARRVRGRLRVLADIDELCIASYGHHELLQMAYLTQDALETAINCMDKEVISGLLSVGATDSMIEAVQKREEAAGYPEKAEA